MKHPKLLAVLLMLVCAVANMCIDYIVKLFDVRFSEVFLFNFAASTTIFASIKWIKNGAKSLIPPKSHLISVSSYLLTVAAGGCLSMVSVRFMPLGDVLVLRYTSVVFAIVFSPCILKTKLLWGKLAIGAIQVAGSVLVIQPPALFHKGMMEHDKYETYDHYWLGCIIMFIQAASNALAFIFTTKLKDVVETLDMLIYQSFCFIFALLATLALGMENRLLTSPQDVELKHLGLCLAVAIAINVRSYSIIWACSIVEPAIPSSARTLEIPMVLAVEIFVFTHIPNYLSIIGTLIAIGSVIVIACYDRLFNDTATKKTEK